MLVAKPYTRGLRLGTKRLEVAGDAFVEGAEEGGDVSELLIGDYQLSLVTPICCSEQELNTRKRYAIYLIIPKNLCIK